MFGFDEIVQHVKHPTAATTRKRFNECVGLQHHGGMVGTQDSHYVHAQVAMPEPMLCYHVKRLGSTLFVQTIARHTEVQVGDQSFTPSQPSKSMMSGDR